MARLVRWQTFISVLAILSIGGLLVQLFLTRQTVVLPARGGTYVEGMVGTPQYLNPLLATSDVDRAVVALLFEGLSTLRSDGSIEPALAESWEVSASATVYTCTLRSAARWHDGQPVTAADVLFTLSLVRSPETPDPNQMKELWSRVQVEALDERHLRFTLERPYAPFLSYTTLPILPAHALQDVAPADLSSSPFNLQPVGSGTFRFVRFQESADGGLSLDLEANPYSEKLPYLEGIRIRFYREKGALVEALLQGEVDGAFAAFSGEALERLDERSDLIAYRTYLQACTILFLNTQSPFLSDQRVRRAIAQGLDRAALLQPFQESVFPATGPISPISWAYKPDLAPLPYDPVTATALLEEAGWRDADGDHVRERDIRSLELTLLTQEVPAERAAVAQGIERQLAPLGIAVRVVVLEDPAEFRRRVAAREFDMLLYGWGQLGRDPDEFALWHSSQTGEAGLNLSSLRSPEVDELLEKGRIVLDRDQRTAIYWEFQERFIQDVPAIPLYYPVYTYVLHARVHGVELQPLNELEGRFHSVGNWYIKTQKVILGRSQPAPQYKGGR